MPKSIEKREKLTLKANQRKENYENNIKVEISLISKIYSRVPQMLQTKIDQNRVTFGNFVPKCYKNETFRNVTFGVPYCNKTSITIIHRK